MGLDILFRTAGKALPPQLIRLAVPGFAGSSQHKRENRSTPQPWHCPPFAEGAMCGLELLYQYETECRIYNENGKIRIDWDWAKEPGGVLGFDEFTIGTDDNSYMFGTSIDLQAPPGYVLRTQPHPRFFTDKTGTVPGAMTAHINTQWWPKKLFVVFKPPFPGQCHVFRKGEPYVQILFVPARQEIGPTRMPAADESRRGKLESDIQLLKSVIAKNVWHTDDGLEFNDHYKTLSRAFDRDGQAGVDEVVNDARLRYQQAIPAGKTTAEYLELVRKYQNEGKFVQAKELLFHIGRLDPDHAPAVAQMGLLGWKMGLPGLAIGSMTKAAALDPKNAAYPAYIGEILRQRGRFAEAEIALRASLNLNATDPVVLSSLGVIVAQLGRVEEGLKACQTAAALGANLPMVHFRLGSILAHQQKFAEARQSFNAALALDPSYGPAIRAAAALPSETPELQNS